MKDMTKKKAPRVSIPPKKKPFSFFRESDKIPKRRNPMAPMTGKKLSK